MSAVDLHISREAQLRAWCIEEAAALFSRITPETTEKDIVRAATAFENFIVGGGDKGDLEGAVTTVVINSSGSPMTVNEVDKLLRDKFKNDLD